MDETTTTFTVHTDETESLEGAVDETTIAIETPPSDNPSPNKAEAVLTEDTSTISESRPHFNTVWKGTVVWFLFTLLEAKLNVLLTITLVDFVRSFPTHFYRSRYTKKNVSSSSAKETNANSHEEIVSTPSDELTENNCLFRGTPDPSSDEEGDKSTQPSQRQNPSSGVAINPESTVEGAVGGEIFKADVVVCEVSLQDDLSGEYGTPISQTSKKKRRWDDSSSSKEEESLPLSVASFSSYFGPPTQAFPEFALEEGECFCVRKW